MEDSNKQNEFSKSEDEAQRASPTGESWKVVDDDYYFNDDGLVVFTEHYLLSRGYCCGSGCKHCPYNYEAVPEPKRSKLREEKRK